MPRDLISARRTRGNLRFTRCTRPMSTPSPTELPKWAAEIIDLYESGARAQFILHGNVDDRLLLPVAGSTARIVGLDTFLRERLLGSFDVVIGYDLGNGIRVEKGGDRFSEWPAAAKDVVHHNN